MKHGGRALNFVRANASSPVVHASIDTKGDECFYRLADGKIFRLTVAEGRAAGVPRWAHLEGATA